jgi:S-(hydroxymethyl)glutathione dehydrogenase/alcohol dehydrogenase
MINKNLAAIIVKQKKNLQIVDLEIPKVPKGFALIKMKYSGICHTQLNEISGILGKDKFLPHCMGHEGVGEIVFLGKLVRNFKVGDFVVVSWVKKKTNKKFSSVSYKKNSTIINSGGCNTLLKFPFHFSL